MSPACFILLFMSVSGPVDSGFTHELPTGQHSAEAVKSVESSLVRRSQNNIQAFNALANDITKRIEFIQHVNEIVEMLDALRRSESAQAVIKNIPGSEWIQMGLDKLSGMVRTLEGIRHHLVAMQTTSKKLSQSIDQYMQNHKGDPKALQDLLLEIERANPVFQRAGRAFKDTEEFLSGVDGVLKQAANTIGEAADVPLIGRVARPTRDKLKQVRTGVEVAAAILKSARSAIARHEVESKGLQHILANGLAHDTYNAGEVSLEQQRLGTALIRYYQVRSRWPDTTWSHQADRRIMETIASLDRLSSEKTQLENRVSHLEKSLETISNQLKEEEERHIQTQDKLTSKTQQVLWISIAMLILVIVGSGLIVARRRKTMDTTEPPSGSP